MEGFKIDRKKERERERAYVYMCIYSRYAWINEKRKRESERDCEQRSVMEYSLEKGIKVKGKRGAKRDSSFYWAVARKNPRSRGKQFKFGGQHRAWWMYTAHSVFRCCCSQNRPQRCLQLKGAAQKLSAINCFQEMNESHVLTKMVVT